MKKKKPPFWHETPRALLPENIPTNTRLDRVAEKPVRCSLCKCHVAVGETYMRTFAHVENHPKGGVVGRLHISCAADPTYAHKDATLVLRALATYFEEHRP